MTEQELAELDLAVARAESVMVDERAAILYDETGDATGRFYRPTRDPAEAMRLLRSYQLCLIPKKLEWGAYSAFGGGIGETPCIAICKAVVALAKAKEAV